MGQIQLITVNITITTILVEFYFVKIVFLIFCQFAFASKQFLAKASEPDRAAVTPASNPRMLQPRSRVQVGVGSAPSSATPTKWAKRFALVTRSVALGAQSKRPPQLRFSWAENNCEPTKAEAAQFSRGDG